MPSTMSPRVAGTALRYALRRLREQAGYKQTDVANHLGIAQPSYAGMELGKRRISVSQLRTALHYFGTPHLYDRLGPLREAAALPNKDEPVTIGTVNDLDLLIGLERYATNVEVFEPHAITGLLQTEAYARYGLEIARDVVPSLDVDEALKLRMERAEVLAPSRGGGEEDQPPLQLDHFLPVSALRRTMGSAQVMVEQLDHLLEMTETRNVRIRVIPPSVSYHPWLRSQYMVVSWGDDLKVAYTEDPLSGHYYDSPAALANVSRMLTVLSNLALEAGESKRLISEIREEYRSQ